MHNTAVTPRRPGRLAFTLLAGTMLAGGSLAGAARAVELPSGGSVAAGGVSIGSPGAGRLSIQQSTPSAIVNWQSFSIGEGGRVDVTQPSTSSALLSRVTGSTPSSVAGELNANGQFYLVNPNGVTITKSGTVRAGGFVASTLDTSDADFLAGRRTFSGRGASAPVVNEGRILIAPGGYAALLGGSVDQSGTVSVPTGKVGYGAGERATLDLSGDGFLQVTVPSRPDGSSDALIRHSGRTLAPGGRVEMRAASARDAVRQSINLSGIVEARSVGGRSGAIVLGGGPGGTVAVSGRLDVSGRSAATRSSRRVAARRSSGSPADGGSIAVTGSDVRLSGATLDASGRNGGTIRVGGDKGGQGIMQNAATTGVDAGTTIRADASGAGTGGSVVVWSDRRTDFAGTISARGGPEGGEGGFAEVSSKGVLAYQGLADLSAARGHYGTLLLDPFNLSITAGPDAGVTGSGGTFTAAANNSVISNTTIQNALATANVTVTTGGAGSAGAQAGDISVLANIAWTAPTALTLSAFRNIAVGNGATPANINVPNGGTLNLRADNSGTGVGTVSFGTGTGTGSVTANTGSAVNIFYNPASNPAGSGVNTTSYTAPTSYAGNVTGGGALTAFMLVNTAADLQNMRNNLAGAYAVGRDIDASPATAFNAGAGFQPVGNTGGAFTGQFNGLGRTISNLSVNTSGTNTGTGLFGAVNGAPLTNITLANLLVTGGDNTGGLAGQATGGTVQNVVVTGNVSGGNQTGGFFGVAAPTAGGIGTTITGSSLNGNVSGGDNTGGLVGIFTGGTITNSTTAGNLTGANTTGGLAGGTTGTVVSNSSSSVSLLGGDNTGGLIGVVEGGSVSNSFATGAVTGRNLVGGLIGLAQDTTLTQLYATGRVQSTSDYAGGLIGGLGGDGPAPAPTTLTRSYANGAVTGLGATGPTYAGGLIGLVSNDAAITDSYATGLVNGSTAAGGLIGQLNTTPFGGATPPASNPTTITNTYATGYVQGGGARGGLIGALTDVNQTVATSYWDTQTTGQTTSAGNLGTGQTTAQLQGALPAGFSATVWGRQAANTYPYLNWRFPSGILAPSGIVRDATGAPIAGEPVRLAAGGTATYQLNSGANGYYYTARDPLTGAQPQGATVYLDGTNRGSSTSDAPTGAGTIPGLDVQVGRALVRTNQTTTSGLAAVLASAGDSALSANIPYTVGSAAGTPTFAANVALFVEAANAAGLTVDRSLIANNSAQIAGAGSTVPTGPVTIAAGNTVQSTGGNVVIATSQFTNNAGATGIQAAGRYLVYSNDYAADTRGGLSGSNLYNRSFASSPPSTIPGTGNTFIFVRQPTLTFGAVNETRQYGTAPPAPTGTVTGFVNGDTAANSYTGAPTITDTTSAATAVGTYPTAIQVAPGSLASTIGYAFAFTNASVTVTPAPLTVTANNQTKLYGNTFTFAGTEFTTSGLRNSDSVTSATLASPGAAPTATVAASPYPISISNAQGSGLSNYTISYVPGALTVTPAPLTVTANNATKTYGNTLTFAGTEFTTSGLRNSDTVTSATLASAGAPATATVAGSPYAITASNAQGSGVSNYTISYVPGALTVTPAPLTVTANNATKTYGNTLTFAGTEFTTSGLRNSDTVTSATLASPGAPASATVAGSPYPISVSNAQGSGVANYTISYVPGALTVTPAPLTVAANNQIKTEGTAFAFTGTEFTASGLRNADTVTSATITSNGAPAAATAAGSPYPINIANASGSGLANYVIAYVPGQFTVTPGASPPPPPPAGPSNLVLALLGNTLNRQLSDFSLPIVATPDTIEVEPSGGGPVSTPAGSALASVQSASNDLQASVAACERRSDRQLRTYTDCVGTALDRFADQLDLRREQLPAQLRSITGAIREAARRVRAARTIGQARAAVRVAVVAVRKAIALIRADEPGGRVGIRQGTVIASALQSVGNSLARATGL